MKVITRSDIYAQIKPKHIFDLKELANSSNKHSYYQFYGNISKGYASYDLDLQECVKNSAHMLRFTNLEVYQILEKAIKIVENTEQYTEYLLSQTFGEPKFIINPPGTVRFYSQDLICFYTGKNWRKIDKPIIHI